MPNINGQEYQHGNISFSISGGPNPPIAIATFKKISYKVTAEKKGVADSMGQPRGYTIDNQKIDASISMLQSEWWAVKDNLLLQNPGLGIGQIACDAMVTFGNSLAPGMQKSEKLIGLMFNEDPRDSQDNQEVLVVELPLFVLDVIDANGRKFIEYPR
jgi:hypothetical protein